MEHDYCKIAVESEASGMGTTSHLGDRLREARARLGMSQEKLARAVDVSSMTISRYERGEMGPTEENLARLCEVLGVEAAWLRYGREQPSPDTRVEPVEDEELPSSEHAIRLLRPMDPDVEAELRAWIESGQVNFSTGAEVSPIVWALEQKKREIEARRRGRAPEPEPEKPRPNMIVDRTPGARKKGR